MTLGAVHPVRAADAGFAQSIASLWPEAQAAGVSRATFDAETRGLEPDYKLPDLMLPGPARHRCAVAGRVRAGAGRLREGSQHRAPGGRGAEAHAEASRHARARSKRGSACPAASCWRSGAAKPITAATGCPITRSACWRRRPLSAAARSSIAASSSLALKLIGDGEVTRKDCARPGPAPPASRSSCRPNSASTASISTATAAATSGIRCRTRWLPRRSSSSTRAGSRACAGPMRCARPPMRIAPWVCPR